MRLVSQLLTILGGNVEPHPDDAVLTVPNVVIPVAKMRRPLRALIAPNTFSTPAESSVHCAVNVYQTGPIALGGETLIWLSPGLWEVSLSYLCLANDTTRMQLPTTWDDVGINWGVNGGFSPGPVLRGFAWNISGTGIAGPIPVHTTLTMNLPEISTFYAITPQLTAGGSSRTMASIVAHRLT